MDGCQTPFNEYKCLSSDDRTVEKEGARLSKGVAPESCLSSMLPKCILCVDPSSCIAVTHLPLWHASESAACYVPSFHPPSSWHSPISHSMPGMRTTICHGCHRICHASPSHPPLLLLTHPSAMACRAAPSGNRISFRPEGWWASAWPEGK